MDIILISFSNGTSVHALVAMIHTILTFVKNVGWGCLYSSEPLYGIMNGERDPEGIQSVFKATLKRGILVGLIITAALILIRQPLLEFYRLSGIIDAHIGLILIAFSAGLWVLPYLLIAVYESTGHLLFVLVVGVIPDSVLYPLFVALSGKLSASQEYGWQWAIPSSHSA